MGFFDDDENFSFENFFKSFTDKDGFTEYTTVGPDGKKKTVRKSQSSQRRIPAKQVLTSNEIFFIFDFSGQEKISVKIPDSRTLEIMSKSKVIGEYSLPEKLKTSGFSNTFRNGILEVKFKR